jgi:hypothetical protein
LTLLRFPLALSAEHLEIRLLTPLSSYSSKPGDEVLAAVIAPLRSEDQVLIPAGSTVRGSVTGVRRVGLGLVRESANLAISFTELILPDGQKVPIRSRLQAVDNARESVDARGVIRGQRATSGLPYRLGMSIFHIPMLNPTAFIPWFLVQNCVFRFPNPEIEFKPGAEMRIQLESELPRIRAAAPVPPVEPEDGLEDLVAAAPYWTYSIRQGKPLDVVNLVFAGSQSAISRAFAAAGWSGSLPMSTGSALRTIRAVAESRSFDRAPMRTLLLDGRRSDMNWQKTLNTMAKRHHLRIWKGSGDWKGQPVWYSAATHDIAMTFSMRSGFDHVVHPEIDLERNKVVNDLLLTGCVDKVSMVRRPGEQPPNDRNHQTDHSVAVIRLNDCGSAVRFEAASLRLAGPGLATRIVRRATLSARHHFIRNNVVWQASEMGVKSLRTALQSRREAIARNRTPVPGTTAGGIP